MKGAPLACFNATIQRKGRDQARALIAGVEVGAGVRGPRGALAHAGPIRIGGGDGSGAERKRGVPQAFAERRCGSTHRAMAAGEAGGFLSAVGHFALRAWEWSKSVTVR